MIRELSGHEIDALHYELLVKDIVSAAEKLPPFPDIAGKIVSLVKAMAPVKDIRSLSATIRQSPQEFFGSPIPPIMAGNTMSARSRTPSFYWGTSGSFKR